MTSGGFAFSQELLQEFGSSQSIGNIADESWNTDVNTSQSLLAPSAGSARVNSQRSNQVVPTNSGQADGVRSAAASGTLRNKYTLPVWGRAASADRINPNALPAPSYGGGFSRANIGAGGGLGGLGGGGGGGRDVQMSVQAKRLEAERRDTREHLLALVKSLDDMRRANMSGLKEAVDFLHNVIVESCGQAELREMRSLLIEKISLNGKKIDAFQSGLEQALKDTLSSRSAEDLAAIRAIVEADSQSNATLFQSQVAENRTIFEAFVGGKLEGVLEAAQQSHVDTQGIRTAVETIAGNLDSLAASINGKLNDLEAKMENKFRAALDQAVAAAKPDAAEQATASSINLLGAAVAAGAAGDVTRATTLEQQSQVLDKMMQEADERSTNLIEQHAGEQSVCRFVKRPTNQVIEAPPTPPPFGGDQKKVGGGNQDSSSSRLMFSPILFNGWMAPVPIHTSTPVGTVNLRANPVPATAVKGQEAMRSGPPPPTTNKAAEGHGAKSITSTAAAAIIVANNEKAKALATKLENSAGSGLLKSSSVSSTRPTSGSVTKSWQGAKPLGGFRKRTLTSQLPPKTAGDDDTSSDSEDEFGWC